jgi:tetratricopeptide (TPR) repeat protein
MSRPMSKLFLALLIIFASACDFTPRLHKDILRAQQYLLSQRYEDAIKTYFQILSQNPTNDIKVKIYYQLGEIYSTYLGDNQEALKQFSMVVQDSTDPLWTVKSLERMADINFSYLRNYEESSEIYLKLTQFKPKLQNADLYEYRYALSVKSLGRIQLAIQAFEPILSNTHHEHHVRSVFEMGDLYFQKREWQTAINYWLDYVKKENRRDNIVQAKFLIANAYETMEELQMAYNLYYSILGEYPNTEVVRNRLRSIYDRRVARKR